MAEAIDLEIKEIKTLIMADDKSLAYASLLVLQRSSAGNTSSMETLALCSPSLLPSVLSDIYHTEEEIAAQALKCLGFMLYHRSIVSSISEGASRSALDLLARLIVTTKMKAICNLGVWCFSVQQLDAVIIEFCIDNVLRAVVYAIDNPFGSLSTTFEAVQAVMKISTQLSKKMRDIAYIWLPPIYRRLLSDDKKERDIAERCLMKTKPIIFPSPPTLLKVVAQDLKKNLLARIMSMQPNNHMKACTIRAWGWYVCLLSSSVLKDRHLVNQMLKLPELTFAHVEPQIQIASLVTWEHMVDAFLPPEMNKVQDVANAEKISNCNRSSERVNDELPKDLLRRIKVLMVPLQGIISSKCDISVHMTCLNTWHYLLHKLDHLVNHPLVLLTTFRPFIEVIFSNSPDNENLCLWKPCLNLLEQYISGTAKSKEMDFVSTSCACDVANEKDITISCICSGFRRTHYCIKWLPCKVCGIDFPLMVIKSIVSHGQVKPIEPEIRTFSLSSALRIYKFVIQRVKDETERPTVSRDMVQLCLNAILRFMKEFCEGVSSRKNKNYSHDLLWITFQFVVVAIEELGVLVLASPLYQVPLDLIYIQGGKSAKISCSPVVQTIVESSVGYMDMVSPMIYTVFLHLAVLVQSTSHLSETEYMPLAIQHVKFLLFSLSPSVNLHAAVCFLYGHLSKPFDGKIGSLVLWRIIAKSLTEKIDMVFDLLVLRKDGADNITYSVLYWFLCYPLILLCSKTIYSDCSGSCFVSPQRDLLLKALVEVLNAFFDYQKCGTDACTQSTENDFLNCLCELLIKVLDENNTYQHKLIVSSSGNYRSIDAFLFYSEMLICILVHTLFYIEDLRVSLEEREKHFGLIKNIFTLFERFLGISLIVLKTNQQSELVIIERVFDAMARLITNLFLKQEVIKLLEVISDPLAQFCLYDDFSGHVWRGVNHQLYCLWANILLCLQRSHPALNFDSTLLRIQASLLRATLDHPYPPISNATLEFWKDAYGKKTILEFPDCLLPVLNRLSSDGGILLQAENGVGEEAEKTSKLNIMKETKTPSLCSYLTKGLVMKRLKYSD